jgi:hypothetical protein
VPALILLFFSGAVRGPGSVIRLGPDSGPRAIHMAGAAPLKNKK